MSRNLLYIRAAGETYNVMKFTVVAVRKSARPGVIVGLR